MDKTTTLVSRVPSISRADRVTEDGSQAVRLAGGVAAPAKGERRLVRAKRAIRRLDALVDQAAIGDSSPLKAITPEHW